MKQINVEENMKKVVLEMNNWKDLLKAKGKLSSKTEMTTDVRPIPQPDKDCNGKLEEYANKLRAHKGILFSLTENEEEKYSSKFGKYTETITGRYNTVPEKVACKLLDMIQSDEFVGKEVTYRSVKVEGVEWKCFVNFDDDWDEISWLGGDWGDTRADAGFMAGCFNEKLHKTTKEYPIILRHHLWLEKKFDKELKAEWFKEVDWR